MPDIHDIIEAYKRTQSIKATSNQLNLPYVVVRRALITEGYLPSEQAEVVAQMIEEGMSIDDIAAKLNIKRSTVYGYLPYTKGSYRLTPQTSNALNIERYRRRKKQDNA